MGLTDDILGNIRGYGTGTSKASYADIINDLDMFGSSLGPGTNIENFNQVISILQGANDNYKQGVHWMIKDIGADVNTFRGKTLTFEAQVKNAGGNTAYIDVRTNDVPPRLFEYKSGPGSVLKSTIIEQFLNRDLLNVDNLNQLEWRLTNRNFTKQELITYLSDPSTLKIVNNFITNPATSAKFRTWFNVATGSTTSNENIVEFVNSNFDLIFKNK